MAKNLFIKDLLYYVKKKQSLKNHTRSFSQNDAASIENATRRSQNKIYTLQKINASSFCNMCIFRGCISDKTDSVQNNSDGSYTEKYQKRKPSEFCIYVNTPIADFKLDLIVYRGLDAANYFVNKVKRLCIDIYKKYLKPKNPLNMSKEGIKKI